MFGGMLLDHRHRAGSGALGSQRDRLDVARLAGADLAGQRARFRRRLLCFGNARLDLQQTCARDIASAKSGSAASARSSSASAP
jgi:hypothetical protein